MDDFRARVRAHLHGGTHYQRDRAYRVGLFAALQTSLFYEFQVTRSHLATRVVIAGGDSNPREFSIEFALEPGGSRRRSTGKTSSSATTAMRRLSRASTTGRRAVSTGT